MARTYPSRKPERGIALITVLMLVAIIASIAAIMLMREQTLLDRAQSFGMQQQFVALEISSNQLAIARAASDESVTVDTLDEPWFMLSEVAEPGNGQIRQQMIDASSRFNLNNLALGSNPESAQVLLRGLFTQLSLNPDLVYALSDYVDSDTEAGEVDEAQSYGRDLINQPLISIEELSMVPGFKPSDIQALKPYVAALPWFVPLNLNTASVTALDAVRRSLGGQTQGQPPPATTPEDGNSAEGASEDQGADTDPVPAPVQDPSDRQQYTQVADFLNSAEFAQSEQQTREVLSTQLSVNSAAVFLVTSAKLGEQERSWITVMQKQGRNLEPIYQLPSYLDDMSLLSQLKSKGVSAAPSP
jgi:type II secretory pathway component PulK